MFGIGFQELGILVPIVLALIGLITVGRFIYKKLKG